MIRNMYESAAREDELEKQRQREKDWQEWNELDEDCKQEVLEFLNRDNDHQYNYKNHKNDRRPEQHHGPGMNQTSVCLGKSKLQFTFANRFRVKNSPVRSVIHHCFCY